MNSNRKLKEIIKYNYNYNFCTALYQHVCRPEKLFRANLCSATHLNAPIITAVSAAKPTNIFGLQWVIALYSGHY